VATQEVRAGQGDSQTETVIYFSTEMGMPIVTLRQASSY